jgi:hypothetical protein
VHVERRERERPREPHLVVVLLRDRGDDAAHPDAVAPHDHRVLLAVLVGVEAAERVGVLGAELEHVADLDPPVDAQRRPALRARVAGLDDRDLAPLRGGEVPSEHHVPRVVVGLVGAGDPPVRLPHRRVGDHVLRAREVGADVALGQLRVRGEVRVGVEADVRGLNASTSANSLTSRSPGTTASRARRRRRTRCLHSTVRASRELATPAMPAVGACDLLAAGRSTSGRRSRRRDCAARPRRWPRSRSSHHNEVRLRRDRGDSP